MEILSKEFKNGDFLPEKYTCQGDDINPPLEFKDVPEGTKSLVLIVDDPDAPGGVWVHWLIWDILPNTKFIDANTVPKNAVEGVTSWGLNGWKGPCPPSGTHRYIFKLYALDIDIKLDSSKTVRELLKTIEGHIIAEAILKSFFKKHQ